MKYYPNNDSSNMPDIVCYVQFVCLFDRSNKHQVVLLV